MLRVRVRPGRGRAGVAALALGIVPLLGVAACGKESPGRASPRAVTVADTGATLDPPAELSMELQHHTMMMIGDGYGKLIHSLADGDGRSAAKRATEMAAFADRIPIFMVHAPDAASDSLAAWARVFKGQLLRVAELSGADSVEAAQQLARQVVLTCGKCHAKYQVPRSGS